MQKFLGLFMIAGLIAPLALHAQDADRARERAQAVRIEAVRAEAVRSEAVRVEAVRAELQAMQATLATQSTRLAQVARAAGSEQAVRAAEVARAGQAAHAADAARSGQALQMMRARQGEGAAQAAGLELERALVTSSAPAPPPPAWLRQDPADSIYRAARAALNEGEYEDAANGFQTLRSRFPRSGYVADSFYYQAFALHRTGEREQLARALRLLEEQARLHPEAGTQGDAASLRVRIQSSLAQRGDARSFSGVREQASGPCEDGNESIRTVALSALVSMDSDQVRPILREVLANREECSSQLREHAIFLLARESATEDIGLFLDLAHRDPDPNPRVREVAIHWLAQSTETEAIQALQTILSASSDRRTQEHVLFSLSQNPSPEAQRSVRAYAERADAPVELREMAIHAIGQQDKAQNVAFLRDLYGQVDDPRVREAIVFSVARHSSGENRDWLLERVRDPSEPLEIRRNALFWIAQSGGLAVGELRTLYRTLPDREVREQVIMALSQRETPEAVDALMEIAREETDSGLRESAVYMLGRSSDPRVPGFLLELIQG